MQLETMDPKDWYSEVPGELFGEVHQLLNLSYFISSLTSIQSPEFKQLAEPTMFAYHKRDIAGNKASVKIAGSRWSKV